MNASGTSFPINSQKRKLKWNTPVMNTRTKKELMEALRYTAKLAELYEAYILEKGIRYIWEADDYIQSHKGPEYPLL